MLRDRLLLRLAILLACSVPLGGVAAEDAARASDPGRYMKRAAIVTGALTLVFAGVGTALVVTQPEGSFATGVGFGHLMWSAGGAVQAIADVVLMSRARRATRPPPQGLCSLRARRWNIALSSVLTAGGLAATVAGLTIDDARVDAGIGTVYATYGGAFVVYEIWALVRAKRRLQKCMQTCSPPTRGGSFAFRF